MKMYSKIFFVTCCVLYTACGNAKTCTLPSYTISYDCGEGTPTAQLPTPETVPYNMSLAYKDDSNASAHRRKLTLLTGDHCTPPAGKTQSGVEIWSGDKMISGPILLKPFTYYFQFDITIRPHYIGPDEADPLLWNIREPVSGTFGKNTTDMTWWVNVPYYGMLRGIASCNSISPATIGAGGGYIADDQDAIIPGNKGSGKCYCWCKLTQPYFTKSKWTYVNGTLGTYDYSECVSQCSIKTSQDVEYFRTSVINAARPDAE